MRLALRPVAVALVSALLIAACAATPPGASAPAASAPTAVSAQPTAAAKQPLQKVTLSYSAVSAFQSLLTLAKNRGLFEKYGLDATVTQVATVEQIKTLVAGKIDIGVTSADNIASAAIGGADLKLVGMFIPIIMGSLWGRPEIKTAADLKGKLVGAPTVGPGIIRYTAEYALRKIGLDPTKDVQWRVFRDTTSVVAAAMSGQIQGVAVVPPDDVALKKAGFNLLNDTLLDKVVYPSGSTYTSGAFIKEHPDIVLAYMKAISEAIAVYKTDKEGTIKHLEAFAQITDREVSESAWATLAKALPDVPKVAAGSLQANLDILAFELPAAKTKDPTTLYDNSFVERLEKEGFYADLLKRYPR